jgi:hypothetical protein
MARPWTKSIDGDMLLCTLDCKAVLLCALPTHQQTPNRGNEARDIVQMHREHVHIEVFPEG